LRFDPFENAIPVGKRFFISSGAYRIIYEVKPEAVRVVRFNGPGIDKPDRITRAEAYLNMGIAYALSENDAKAAAAFKRAMLIDPDGDAGRRAAEGLRRLNR